MHYVTYGWHNRLIGYRCDYSRAPGDYYWLQKYVWEHNRITCDNIWLRGAGLDTIVIELEYDDMDRVVTESRKMIFLMSHLPDSQNEITHYTYDDHGKLVNAVQSNYDYKVNHINTTRFSSLSIAITAGTVQLVPLAIPLQDCKPGSAGSIPAAAGFLTGTSERIEYNCLARRLDFLVE